MGMCHQVLKICRVVRTGQSSEIKHTQNFKKKLKKTTLCNWTKQDNMCKIVRRSSFFKLRTTQKQATHLSFACWMPGCCGRRRAKSSTKITMSRAASVNPVTSTQWAGHKKKIKKRFPPAPTYLSALRTMFPSGPSLSCGTGMESLWLEASSSTVATEAVSTTSMEVLLPEASGPFLLSFFL